MRCALIHGARGDTERAGGTAITSPSAARSARRTHAVVLWQAATANPEALHRCGATPRAGTPQWPHTGGERSQSLQNPCDAVSVRRSYFRLPAMTSLL